MVTSASCFFNLTRIVPNHSAFWKRNHFGQSRASRLRLAQDCTSKSFLGETFGKSAADWVWYEKEDFGQYLPEDSGEVESASQRTRPLCVLRARKIYGGDGDRSAWQKKKNWQAVPPPLKVVTHELAKLLGTPQPPSPLPFRVVKHISRPVSNRRRLPGLLLKFMCFTVLDIEGARIVKSLVFRFWNSKLCRNCSGASDW